MKVRNALAVTGITLLGVVGVYGTSSAATTQPDKTWTLDACVVASGSTGAPAVTGKAPAKLTAPPTRAIGIPVHEFNPALGTFEDKLLPAHLIAGSCTPIVGHLPTVTLNPAQPATGAPTQVTAPATK